MEKQKIVVKVSMNGEKKTRKALKIAVSISGVESAAFVGSDQIEVKGAGIDSVELTTLLRKKVGYTELVSVGPADTKKPESKPADPKPADPIFQVDPYQFHYYDNYVMPYYYPVY